MVFVRPHYSPAAAAVDRFRPIRMQPTLHDLHQAIKLNRHAQVWSLLFDGRGKLNVNSSLLSRTALNLAIYRADERIVANILAAGADPNKLSCDKSDRIEAPLLAACRLGKTSIARLLVAYGADVNCVDAYPHTPLWLAVRDRNLLLAQMLLESGARIAVGDVWTQCPLYLAAKYYGREPLARLLILHGCRLDCKDADGNSILYWTIVNGQFELARLLLRAGCQVEDRLLRMLLQQEQSTTTNAAPPPTRHPTSSHVTATSSSTSSTSSSLRLQLPELLREHPEQRAELGRAVTTVPELSRLAGIVIRKQLIRSPVNRGQSIWPLVDCLPLPAVYKHCLKHLVDLPSHYRMRSRHD